MYVTPAQLSERPGARELAQVASDAHKRVVDFELMELTLQGGDRTAYSDDDVAHADSALQRIIDAITDADGLINGFLVKRYPVLPLDPVPRLVTAWSRDITRYLLNKDRLSAESTDPIVRNYKEAMKQLQQVAEGKLNLGIDDPIAESPNSTDVRFDYDTKVFGRDELKRFR